MEVAGNSEPNKNLQLEGRIWQIWKFYICDSLFDVCT